MELVDRLEDKMKLIELCLTMAYDAKVNFMDVLGSTKYWDILIYNFLLKKNIVIPQKRKSEKSEKFEGAYVKEPQLGMHKWIMSFDLNSLYPHLIMQYNISPETLVAQDKVKDMSVDKLDKFVEKRNRKQKLCEYLWSHPNFTKGGSRQTMQPIIIQQDRAFLTELRNKRG